MTKARLVSLLFLAAMVASLLGKGHHGGFGGSVPGMF
jgi:hypothetical protein